jgi:hypothetical protein
VPDVSDPKPLKALDERRCWRVRLSACGTGNPDREHRPAG